MNRFEWYRRLVGGIWMYSFKTKKWCVQDFVPRHGRMPSWVSYCMGDSVVVDYRRTYMKKGKPIVQCRAYLQAYSNKGTLINACTFGELQLKIYRL